MDFWEPPAIEVSSWRPPINSSAPVAVELCCGMGAIGIGLRSLGIRVANAYDSWNAAVAIYNHNAPEPVAVECDLLSREGHNRVVSDCSKLGELEMLVAGPPCKGFSKLLNGKHEARNPHNRLLRAIPDYVASLKPRTFLIENVPDLIRHAGGRTFKNFLTRLGAPGPRRLRYRIEFHVYDASQYGTPQSRRRVFVFGVRKGDEKLPLPGPDFTPLYTALRKGHKIPVVLRPYMRILRDNWDPRIVSAKQALSDLPRLGPGTSEAPRLYGSLPKSAYQRIQRNGSPDLVSNTRTPTVKSETVKRLRHVPPGGCAGSIPPRHLNGLLRRFASAYRRLHPDVPSTVLSTKYDCAFHYAYSRSLSVREYARIQGIPDCVTFPEDLVSRRSAYELIGNSVPPLLVRAILAETLRFIEKRN